MSDNIEIPDAKKKTDLVERKDPPTLEQDAQTVMMEALKIKKAEIDTQLAQIEKRNNEFREMVEDMKLSGRGNAGKPEQSEKEKAIQAARNLIAGSGFEDRLSI